MSIWIDRKFLLLLSPKLELFKRKSDNLYNFRCPYCNDSQKVRTKTRGYVYSSKNNYFFSCHNCSKNTSLRTLIDFLDPYLAREYILENYAENSSHIKREFVYNAEPPKFYNPNKCTIDLPTIKSLSKNHHAKQYLLNRKIPETRFADLYYAEDFKEYVSTVSDKILPERSPRIVLPFFSRSGNLIAVQGRALDNYSIRYITIKIVENAPKIFGAEKIDISKPIWVVEGGLDALFLPNAIATADSNLSAAQTIFDKKDLVLIADREPRNIEIVKNIERFINSGFKVCLFPRFIKGKDINEMVLNGLTPEDICDIIESNTFQGLRAKLEFLSWRKV